MPEITNLDPRKSTVTVGSRFLTGFAPDGIFTLVWNADRVSLTVGSQGDGVYVENADESAILTVTLSPTSSSVTFLEEMCFNRASYPVTVNDASPDARITYYSPKCRVQKPADKNRGPSASTVSYSIIMPKVSNRGRDKTQKTSVATKAAGIIRKGLQKIYGKAGNNQCQRPGIRAAEREPAVVYG